MKARIYTLNQSFLNTESKAGRYYCRIPYNQLVHPDRIRRCNYDLVHTLDHPARTQEEMLEHIRALYHDCPLVARPLVARPLVARPLAVSDVIVLDDAAFYVETLGYARVDAWDTASADTLVHDRCDNCGCKDTSVYGCVSECAGRGIKDSERDCARICDEHGRVAVPYENIEFCEKWRIT